MRWRQTTVRRCARRAPRATRLLRESLREASERLRLNEELARLHDGLDLGGGPLVAPITKAAWSEVSELFAELELESLTARVQALAGHARD